MKVKAEQQKGGKIKDFISVGTWISFNGFMAVACNYKAACTDACVSDLVVPIAKPHHWELW